MIYELRTYTLVLGGAPQYIQITKEELLPLLAEHGLKPLGYWSTDIGPLNELVHLWAFKDLNERQQKCSQAALAGGQPEQQDHDAGGILRTEIERRTSGGRMQIKENV
jgi:hypothetical protein